MAKASLSRPTMASRGGSRCGSRRLLVPIQPPPLSDVVTARRAPPADLPGRRQLRTGISGTRPLQRHATARDPPIISRRVISAKAWLREQERRGGRLALCIPVESIRLSLCRSNYLRQNGEVREGGSS